MLYIVIINKLIINSMQLFNYTIKQVHLFILFYKSSTSYWSRSTLYQI